MRRRLKVHVVVYALLWGDMPLEHFGRVSVSRLLCGLDGVLAGAVASTLRWFHRPAECLDEGRSGRASMESAEVLVETGRAWLRSICSDPLRRS